LKLKVKLQMLRVLISRMLVMEKLLQKLLVLWVRPLLKKRKRKKTAIRTSRGSGRNQSHKSLLLKSPPERRLLRKSLTRSRW